MSNASTHAVMYRGLACCVAGGIFWGFSGVCCQYLFENNPGLDPMWLTAVRMLVAGALLLLIVSVQDAAKVVRLSRSPRDILSILFYSILISAPTQYLYLLCVSLSNAGTATVLQFNEAVIVMLWVCLSTRVLPNRFEVLAVISAVTGVFLFATHASLDSLAISSESLAVGLTCAVVSAFYSAWPVKLIVRYGSFLVTAVSLFLGGVVLCLFNQVWTVPYTLDTMSTLAFGGLIFIGTALAFSLYFRGVGEIGPMRATMILSTEPLSATVLSWLLLGTVFTMWDWIGFSLVIMTVFLMFIPPKVKNKTEKESAAA